MEVIVYHLFSLCYYKVNNDKKVVREIKDYYLLVGLNSKEIKILNVNQKGNGLIEVGIENKRKKIRCPICNKFTSSVHSK